MTVDLVYNGSGDWFENKDKSLNGIDGLAEKIEALDVKLGLWFYTKLYEEHPD